VFQLQYAVVEMKSAFEAALDKLSHLEDRPPGTPGKDNGQLAEALRLLISYKVYLNYSINLKVIVKCKKIKGLIR